MPSMLYKVPWLQLHPLCVGGQSCQAINSDAIASKRDPHTRSPACQTGLDCPIAYPDRRLPQVILTKRSVSACQSCASLTVPDSSTIDAGMRPSLFPLLQLVDGSREVFALILLNLNKVELHSLGATCRQLRKVRAASQDLSSKPILQACSACRASRQQGCRCSLHCWHGTSVLLYSLGLHPR